MQEPTERALYLFSQEIGAGQEARDVVTESSSDVKVPTVPLVGRRDLHAPHAHQVAERVAHSLFDSDNRRRVGDVSNLNVNRIEDDEHGPQKCKSGTDDSSSLACSGVQGRSESCRQKSEKRLCARGSRRLIDAASGQPWDSQKSCGVLLLARDRGDARGDDHGGDEGDGDLPHHPVFPPCDC